MRSIILFVFLGFIFPGHSVPLSPRTHVPEKRMAPIDHIDPLILGNSVILRCVIENFFPKDADMQWLKSGQPVPENEYVNTQAVKEKSGDSHFAFRKLTIPNLSSAETFNCMIVQEGLEMK